MLTSGKAIWLFLLNVYSNCFYFTSEISAILFLIKCLCLCQWTQLFTIACPTSFPNVYSIQVNYSFLFNHNEEAGHNEERGRNEEAGHNEQARIICLYMKWNSHRLSQTFQCVRFQGVFYTLRKHVNTIPRKSFHSNSQGKRNSVILKIAWRREKDSDE